MTTPDIHALLARLERAKLEIDEISQGLAELAREADAQQQADAAEEEPDEKTPTQRIVERLWIDHHLGRTTSTAHLVHELGVERGTVKSVRHRWNRGFYRDRYPDPFTTGPYA